MNSNFSFSLASIISVVRHITRDAYSRGYVYSRAYYSYQFSPAQNFWIFPLFITHTEYVADRSDAYAYYSIHYKIQSFLQPVKQ